MFSTLLIQIYHNSLYLLIFICIVSLSNGQNLHNLVPDKKDMLLRIPEGFVIETEINKDTYILGPGDKIGLSIITSANMAYILTITPMGELWIPDLGSVHIAGMNVHDAEAKLTKYIHSKRFKSADIVLVILNIRHYKIQIIGAVHKPGMVTISSVDRLADVIIKSGGLHKLANEDKITILTNNGEKVECSLRSYHMNGNLNNNPVLNQHDVIIVPYSEEHIDNINASISHKQSLIFVTGFVLRPKAHTFIPGYTLNDYIAMSGGITDFGSRNNIIIYRNEEILLPKYTEVIMPDDQINIPANMKYRMLGNMSVLQTVTAMMTLYLTYQAAIN